MPELEIQDKVLVHGMVAGGFDKVIILALPGTDYRLYLYVRGGLAGERPPQDAPIRGMIHVRAKRVDVVRNGGRFIEPVYGSPRHIQGIILATDPAGNSITVESACPWICKLTVGQKAEEFSEGQLVAFDVEHGAEFSPLPVDAMERPEARAHGVVDDHSDPTPAGCAPTEGHQGPMRETTPGRAIHDSGALNSGREITGMEAPPADFPLSEMNGGTARGGKKDRAGGSGG